MLSIAMSSNKSSIIFKFMSHAIQLFQMMMMMIGKGFEKVSKLLKVFNIVVNIIYGGEYPTANLYLVEVFQTK